MIHQNYLRKHLKEYNSKECGDRYNAYIDVFPLQHFKIFILTLLLNHRLHNRCLYNGLLMRDYFLFRLIECPELIVWVFNQITTAIISIELTELFISSIHGLHVGVEVINSSQVIVTSKIVHYF